MLKSPFYNISKSNENKLTIALLVYLSILIPMMLFFDIPLKNEVAPNGIVSFELAKELIVSENILNS